MLLAGCIGACIPDRVLRDDNHVDDRVVADITHSTAQARQLPFDRDVPVEVMNVDEVEQWLNRDLDATKRSLRRQDWLYHRLGILAPDRSAAAAFAGFYGGLAAGFYDDDRIAADGQPGTMVVVHDYAWWLRWQYEMLGALSGIDAAYGPVLAHELTHALQDQHFSLRGGGDNDGGFARRAVLETEANLIGMAHLYAIDLEQFVPRKLFLLFLRYNQAINGPLMLAARGKTPSFIAQQGFAQYDLGLSFIERALDRGERSGRGAMAELSRVYTRPPGIVDGLPLTTHTLLTGHTDAATALAGVDADDLLSDMTQVASNRFGALALSHWLSSLRPWDGIIDGWRNDRYDLWMQCSEADLEADRCSEQAATLVWQFAMATDDVAHTLVLRLEEHAQQRYGHDRWQAQSSSPNAIEAIIAAAPASETTIRTVRKEWWGAFADHHCVVLVEGAADGAQRRALASKALSSCLLGKTAAPKAPPPQPDIEAAIARAPPVHHREDDPRSFWVLPWRTLEVRADMMMNIDNATTRNLLQLRWGAREHLELSLPLAATLSVRNDRLMAALRWSGQRLEQPVVALLASGVLHNNLAVAAQLEASPWRHDEHGPWRLSASLLMRPLPSVRVAPAVCADEGDIELGGCFSRAGIAAPLAEVEALPGLWITGGWSARLRASEHTVNLGLRLWL
jgi:hypothetical protein